MVADSMMKKMPVRPRPLVRARSRRMANGTPAEVIAGSPAMKEPSQKAISPR